MKNVQYIVLNMENKNQSPIISFHDTLQDAIDDTEDLAVDNKINIWIDHWENGFSVRILKFNEETEEFESYFDDNYIPELEDALDDELED